MASLAHIRLPSFSLVITSGCHSLHGYPTAVKFDPCASYTMLPVVVDHLMKTIHLSGEPADDNLALNQITTRLGDENIMLEEELSTVPSGMKKGIARTTKQHVLKAIQSFKKRLSRLSTRGIF